MAEISEKSFEDAVEAALLAGGPDAGGGVAEPISTYGDMVAGGYRRRTSGDYDPDLCLIGRDALDFLTITQPHEWAKYKKIRGKEAAERFLGRLAREVRKRGTLDVLRRGVADAGCRFRLAYLRPASGLNEELQRLYEGNLFSVVRQLRYNEAGDALDLALFLNGLPLFTAELKNPFTGQNVDDAIYQYKHDRDPRDPLLAFRRCLAHFAVDVDKVYVTTRLEGAKTFFLPFNQGFREGAGNPPASVAIGGYATSYLWNRIWARDSVLDLVQHFVHELPDDDSNGRNGKKRLIFPRFHQLDAVRRLVAHAREHGPGQRYLVQHSAGSGKSNSIAWLAHRLSILHDAADRRVFDSILVVTDRKVLDRQLQETVRQFEQTLGVVENIDQTSRQLKEALESGKTIIVTTVQKFPVIVDGMRELAGQRFAVIVDEAHSSQTGDSARSLKRVLAVASLEEAEREDVESGPDPEDRMAAELEACGPLANVSTFAFTATPKPKTLELFGSRGGDGSFAPFSLYSMRQAIEEGFILDVLAHYTTYKSYWRLLKKIEDDPHFDKKKASYVLRSAVELHAHAIREKVAVMVDHFAEQAQHKIGGQAKAMIVTRSRLHAVRYKQALDAYLGEKGHAFKALVAFSGTVEDEETGKSYTEPGMNGLPEAQTAATYHRPEYRFLVVAEKFQTGFDEPLLHTMYVDKKLTGVHAVQTLSRLNRIHPPLKTETMVLDFVNEAEEIRKAFEPYYETTILSEGTDPNLIYDLENELYGYGVFTREEVAAFARLYYDDHATQADLYAALGPQMERFCELDEEDRLEFRGHLSDYGRLYAFLSQITPFPDRKLLELFHFVRFLHRRLPGESRDWPEEVRRTIDLEDYGVRRTREGAIALDRAPGRLKPRTGTGRYALDVEELEPLSRIIETLNARFGGLSENVMPSVAHVLEKLENDEALDVSARVNSRDGKAVCVVACQRSARPVYLKWKGVEKSKEGDFYVRTGPGSRTLEGEEIAAYLASHFGGS